MGIHAIHIPFSFPRPRTGDGIRRSSGAPAADAPERRRRDGIHVLCIPPSTRAGIPRRHPAGGWGRIGAPALLSTPPTARTVRPAGPSRIHPPGAQRSPQGTGSTHMRISPAVSISLVLLAAACSDLPTDVAPGPRPGPATFRTELRCTAQAAPARLTCDAGGPEGAGPTRSLIVGGQHVYVRMVSSGAGYNPSDSLFSVSVSVQNLMAQAFGTPDGMVGTGLRVFFASGPVAASGPGSVAVHNADGTGFFTEADQPYFTYEGPLYPGFESEEKTWEFRMDPEVPRFVFSVLVEGQLPHESSLLRFRPQMEPGAGVVLGLWGASASDVFAVGALGALHRYTGGTWTTDESLTDENLWDVWGSSATDVFAVGTGGAIVRWNGADWQLMDSGLEDDGCGCGPPGLYGVWGSGPSDVFAVGDGGIVARYDGAQWTAADTLPVEFLSGVWGTGPTDVFAVGGDGGIFHFDGAEWTQMTSGLEGTGEYLNAVWGLSSTDVYAAASTGLLHYDGVDWTPVPDADTCEHYGVWGSAADDLFVANVCGVGHWDGSTWTYMDPGGSFVTELWGAGPLHLLANTDGGIFRGSR